MSSIDPTAAAEETLSAVAAAAQVAAPVLAIANPQAAAVASALEIGVPQLQKLIQDLKTGATHPTDAAQQAQQIAAAIQATHDAWAQLSVPKANT